MFAKALGIGWLALACAALGSACGDGDDAPKAPNGSGSELSAALREQLYQSGSRLKARLVGDAKARTFQGFFDEELGIRCEFARASDGRMYCLPTGAPPSLVYSDAECTVPVGKELDECSKSEGYTVVESGHVLDCEPPVTRVYEPVSKPLPEKSYFASFDGCSAGSTGPTPGP